MTEKILYKLVEDPDGNVSGSLVNTETMEIRVFDNKHPLYKLISEQILDGDLESAFESANARKYLEERAQQISENIFLGGDHNLYYQGVLLPEGIARTIMDAIEDGTPEGVQAVTSFIERVLVADTNTSRTALFSWIKDRKLSLTLEGEFIAYKGVMVDSDGTPRSISTGPGVVNGEKTSGHLDNSIGNVLSVDRSYVEQEPGEPCGPGLHAGTYNFAKGFSQGLVLAVKIAPENVVSVPVDCHYQKLRVCQYTVVGVVEEESEDLIY